MKKLASQWAFLTIMLMVGTLILSIFTSAAIGQTESNYQEEGFRYDPSLSETPVEQGTSAVSPLTIESSGDQTNLSVETRTPISPYLGVVEKTTDGPDDMSHRLSSRSDNPLDNYHLETGVGIMVNEQTEMNMGYRFNHSPTLLDDQSSEAPSYDLRFSLDIKLPF